MKRKEVAAAAPRKRVRDFHQTWGLIVGSPKHLQEVCASHSPRAIDALFVAMLDKDTPRVVFDEIETLGLFKDEYAVHLARAALKENDIGMMSRALSKTIRRCDTYRLLRASLGNDDMSALVIEYMFRKSLPLGITNIDMIVASSMVRSIVAATKDARFTCYHLKTFYDNHRIRTLVELFEAVDVDVMIRLGACFMSLIISRSRSHEVEQILQRALQRSGERRLEFINSLVYPKEQCVPLPTTRAMLMRMDDIMITLIELFNANGVKWNRRDREHSNRTPSLVAAICAARGYITVETARRVILDGGGSLYRDDNLGMSAFGYVVTLKAPLNVLKLVFTAYKHPSRDRHMRFTTRRDFGPNHSSMAVCLAESDYPFSYTDYPFSYTDYQNDLATRIRVAVKYMARMPLFERSIERRHYSDLFPVQLMALNFKQVLPELKSASSSWSTVLYNLMLVKSRRVPLSFILKHMRLGVEYLISEGHVTVEEVAGMATSLMVPFWDPSWGRVPEYGLDESVRQLCEIDSAPQWMAVSCIKLAERFHMEDIVSALERHALQPKYLRIKKELVFLAYSSTYHSNWVKATVGKLFRADGLVLDLIAKFVCFGETRLPYLSTDFAKVSQRVPRVLGELPYYPSYDEIP